MALFSSFKRETATAPIQGAGLSADVFGTTSQTTPTRVDQSNFQLKDLALAIPRAGAEFAVSAGEAIPRVAAGVYGLTDLPGNQEAQRLSSQVIPPTDLPGAIGKMLGPIQSIQSQYAQAQQEGNSSLAMSALQLFTDEPMGFAFKPLFLGLGLLGKVYSKDLITTLSKAPEQDILGHLTKAYPEVPPQFFEDITPKIVAAKGDVAQIQQVVGDTAKRYVDELSQKLTSAEDVYTKANKNAFDVPISKLNISQDAIDAIGDVEKGVLSKSELPLLVQKNADGTYDVLDGNHRLVKMFQSGKTNVPVIANETVYRELAAQEEKLFTKVAAHDRTGTGGVKEYLRKAKIDSQKGFIKNPFEGKGSGAETSPLPKPKSESVPSANDTISKDLASEAKKYQSADDFASHYVKNPHEISISPEYKKYLSEQDAFIKRETAIYTRINELRDRYKDVSQKTATPRQLKQEKIDRAEYVKLQDELGKSLSKKTMARSPEGDIKTHIGDKALHSQLTDFYNKTHAPTKLSSEGVPMALSKKEKEIVKNSTQTENKGVLAKESKKTVVSPALQKDAQLIEESPKTAEKSTGLVSTAASTASSASSKEVASLSDILLRRQMEVKSKINIIDYLRTPDRVLNKIGLGKEAKLLRDEYEGYVKELPKNIDKITAWSKEVPKSSTKTIFQYLDGQAVELTEKELQIAGEIKAWLAGWAKRLKLPEDKTITNYITHIFDKELIAKEFDEDLAKIITDKIPGSVYDPFLLRRLGKMGYKEDVWQALDAYVKRATRKVNLDPALEAIQQEVGSSLEMSNVEVSQFKYVQKYIANVNMRPSDLDNLLDNTIKSMVGYKYGQRPITSLLRTLRQMTYRGMLGLNPGSALRNISQGINTYAVLGEKYTTVGYLKLFSRGAMKELDEEGVMAPGFIQDRTLSSTKKTIEKIDKGLFAFFDAAEKINRGAAYFGAKSKALKAGKSLEEAVDYAKETVRKTQFSFGSIDTPVAMQGDIVKTLAQFQNYTIKQTEFLAEMAKDKNFVGLLRYGVAGVVFVSTVGKLFGMDISQLIPSFRFDTPPSLKLPVEIGKAALNTPDKYNQPRSLKQKAQDIGNSAVGLIPGGTQLKKSIQGAQAYNAGKDVTASGKTRYKIPHTPVNAAQSVLFGKNSLPQAKTYFNTFNNKVPEKKRLFSSFK